MPSFEAIKQKIEDNLPGAKADVFDPMNDGQHLKAVVVYAGFEGKSLVEQHQMVMNLLKEELKGEIHALSLETKVQ